ncbi:hypothetical protein SI65_05835 [Aspergillus cristatus]|uniref:Uncharacterized protein n=1 Tax=Aspergillus cristatus TaxID=573508 RepID=A0A1E3BEA6_ASPCR|nr:hypothetical protein SI65_05835 [Aspergillus cristatus]
MDTSRMLRERVRSESHRDISLEEQEGSHFLRREYLDRLLPEHRKTMRDTLSQAIKDLPQELLWHQEPNAELLDGKLECIICLDEAAQLFKPRKNQNMNKSRFAAWRRALRHRATSENQTVKKLQCFGVVTDTTSRVSDLFNVLADKTLYNINKLPMNGQQLDDRYHRALFSFGRPLWGTLLSSNRVSIEDVKVMLRQKVPGFKDLHPSDKDDPNTAYIRALALIGYRCQFFITLSSLAEHLCSTYLRFIADVSDDRTLVRTLQPSEPVLSWMAAEAMKDPQTRLAMVDSLWSHTQRKLIHIGDLGEMVSMLILLYSFDKAHGHGRPRPITVADLFQALLPKEVHKKLASRCQKDSKFRQVWSGSVFFSHFLRTEKNDRKVTVGCDLIIPILFDQPRKWSYVLIQVKNAVDMNLTDSMETEALSARAARRP